jgi:hypothetical protein
MHTEFGQTPGREYRVSRCAISKHSPHCRIDNNEVVRTRLPALCLHAVGGPGSCVATLRKNNSSSKSCAVVLAVSAVRRSNTVQWVGGLCSTAFSSKVICKCLECLCAARDGFG